MSERKCKGCDKTLVRHVMKTDGRIESAKVFAARSYCSRECSRSYAPKHNPGNNISRAQRETRNKLRGEGALKEAAAIPVKWTPFEIEKPVYDRCWSGYKEGRRCIRMRGHYRDPGPGASPHEDSKGKKWFGPSPDAADMAAREPEEKSRTVTKKFKVRKRRTPSGFVGVSRGNNKSGWEAHVCHGGRKLYVGTFKNPEAAREAREEWKKTNMERIVAEMAARQTGSAK